MTGLAALLEQAAEAGLSLTVANSTVLLAGPLSAREKFAPLLRPYKAELLAQTAQTARSAGTLLQSQTAQTAQTAHAMLPEAMTDADHRLFIATLMRLDLRGAAGDPVRGEYARLWAEQGRSAANAWLGALEGVNILVTLQN